MKIVQHHAVRSGPPCTLELALGHKGGDRALQGLNLLQSAPNGRQVVARQIPSLQA